MGSTFGHRAKIRGMSHLIQPQPCLSDIPIRHLIPGPTKLVVVAIADSVATVL
jgi:hypothetical protein